jgi:hypothetical protein
MLDRPNTKAGWLARAADLTFETRAFIGGVYVDAVSKRVFERASPIDGRVAPFLAAALLTELP